MGKGNLQTDREAGGLGQKREGGKVAFIYFLFLLLIVWPFQRDAFMCYLYNYRNTRNKKFKKLLLKLTWLTEVQEDRYKRTGHFKELVTRNNHWKDFVSNIHIVISSHYAKCWGYKKEQENVSQLR